MPFPIRQPSEPHVNTDDGHEILYGGDAARSDAVIVSPTAGTGHHHYDEEDIVFPKEEESNRQKGNSHANHRRGEKDEELEGLLSDSRLSPALENRINEIVTNRIAELTGVVLPAAGRTKDSTNAGNRNSPLFGFFNNSANQEEGNLDPDTFTLMMFAFPKTYKFWTKEFWNEEQAWLLGMFTCIAQILLGALVIDDQVFTEDSYGKSILSIPVNVNTRPVYFAQFLTIPLALATQTDVITSLMTIQQLKFESDWHDILKIDEKDKTYAMWRRRVLLPNVLKFLEGLFILFASWVIICQSGNVVDLLKDFTALFAISTVDDIMFILADGGQLGEELKRKAREVKDAKVEQGGQQVSGPRNKFIMALILAIMFGGWIFIVVYGQHEGYLFRNAYSNCPFVTKDFHPQSSFSNGECDWFLNSAECGYDGKDCDLYNQFSDCHVWNLTGFGDGKCDINATFNTFECGYDGGDCAHENYRKDLKGCVAGIPEFLGDGMCDDPSLYTPELVSELYDWDEEFFNGWKKIVKDYNTEACGFDMGDCLIEGYEKCLVLNKTSIGDGKCDGGRYNTKECGFDNGDCKAFNDKYYLKCNVTHPYLIGNGRCDGGAYNTEECDYDGGDCKIFNQYYQSCNVDDPSKIGDGKCDGGDYDTAECGYDGGDCSSLSLNCNVLNPEWIGDGECDGGYYNTEECNFDGGDCENFNDMYPDCHVHIPDLIGDGVCNREYNTEECNFDGGDCENFNDMYPNCHVDIPDWIGDGVCDFGDYNTTECSYDGGDCL